MDITTYSFQDLTGSISDPVAGEYLFQGQMGVGSLTISRATENTVHDLSAEGSVMVSKIPGTNGSVSIEVQQTSDLHKWLLDAYNLKYYNSDSSVWASMSMMLRNIADGTSHILSGVSFQKVPDKGYAAQGGRITWVLMAADIQDGTV